jgi:hypothetical protein
MREVEEETGLTSDDLTGLELKYIILRIKETEIRLQYVGRRLTTEVPIEEPHNRYGANRTLRV